MIAMLSMLHTPRKKARGNGIPQRLGPKPTHRHTHHTPYNTLASHVCQILHGAALASGHGRTHPVSS
jgi:hypothetical protein